MSVKVFSQEFATLLKTNNETIKSVSETLDIPFSTLQRYSKGEVSNLNIDYIERVAEHFDVPISRLLGKKDISPDSRLLNEAYNQSRIAYEERLNEKKKTIHFCRWVISLQTVLIIALVAFIFYVLLVDAQDGASGIIRYTLCR